MSLYGIQNIKSGAKRSRDMHVTSRNSFCGGNVDLCFLAMRGGVRPLAGIGAIWYNTLVMQNCIMQNSIMQDR